MKAPDRDPSSSNLPAADGLLLLRRSGPVLLRPLQIETTLSLRRIPEYGASPVWALISAGGIRALPVLAGIESLWIAVDQDEAGIGAARVCADRWAKAGRETRHVTPRSARTDLNDAFKGRAHG